MELSLEPSSVVARINLRDFWSDSPMLGRSLKKVQC